MRNDVSQVVIKKKTNHLCLAFHTQGTKRAMLFEVKVSEPVAKSVNNKIVQFYPVEAVIVRCDDDDIGGGEYDKKKNVDDVHFDAKILSIPRVVRVLFDKRCAITSVSSESVDCFSATLRGEESSF